MEQAISPEFRERERLYEKARHDEAQALYHAEQKGLQEGMQKGRQESRQEIARTALQMKMAVEDIMKLTGFTREEILKLSHD